MWTEAHRARHEPGLKAVVAACAVEEIAAWLERADPPRSGRATPVRRVVGAVAWHLRVGGPWRALPAGWPPWRTVYGWFRRWLELGLLDAPLREVAPAACSAAPIVRKWPSNSPRAQAACRLGAVAGIIGRLTTSCALTACLSADRPAVPT